MARRIAYIVSRFPKISETFILYEILDLQRRGMEIEIYSLLRQQESKIHPEAETLAGKAHYTEIFSWSFWFAQLYWLSRRPFVYIRSWWKAIRGNLFSPKFLLRALAVVPIASRFALDMLESGVKHVHAHFATHPALAAYVIRELTGLPYSITAHAHDIYVNQSMLEEKLRKAEFIITISEYNRRLLNRYGSQIADKIHVVHCGIDPEIFQPPTKVTAVHRDVSPFLILCIASLNDYKGHRYLIEACSTIKNHIKNFQCILIGDGPERKRVEVQVASSGLEKLVRLLGWQNRNEVCAWLSQADVVVLPSAVAPSGKQEGIPVVLMEALAMGVPVISTSISGIPELVEDGKSGLLVPERDPTSLAAALLFLNQQPEMSKQMAAVGRAKVLSEFNLHINSGILARLFCGEMDTLLLNHPYPKLEALQSGASC